MEILNNNDFWCVKRNLYTSKACYTIRKLPHENKYIWQKGLETLLCVASKQSSEQRSDNASINHTHLANVCQSDHSSLSFQKSHIAELDLLYTHSATLPHSQIMHSLAVSEYTQQITSNVTSIIEVWSASAHLFAGTRRPLVSVITTVYYVAIIFHRRVRHRALSLRYACVQSSGIILIP